MISRYIAKHRVHALPEALEILRAAFVARSKAPSFDPQAFTLTSQQSKHGTAIWWRDAASDQRGRITLIPHPDRIPSVVEALVAEIRKLRNGGLLR